MSCVDPNTIVAIATPPGRGGVGVLRISGAGVREIAHAMLQRLPPARYADYREFADADGETIDVGLALYFPGPHSYTGEDVLELHAHGSPVVLDLLLQRVVALGARRAEPGEFTQRAFLNGKLDLAQAEAVADLIASASEQAARSALNSLQGAFSAEVQRVIDKLVQLRVGVEGDLDFTEEQDATMAEDSVVRSALGNLNETMAELLQQAERGAVLSDGMNVALIGKPNVGKSSLFNRLVREQRAIVAASPGTTRDVIRQSIQLDGIPVELVDTAGLRQSEDPVEREGITRAEKAGGSADLVIEIHEYRPGEPPTVATDPRTVIVYNKIDLHGLEPSEDLTGGSPVVYLSARTGQGVAALEAAIKRAIGPADGTLGDFSARARHLDALRSAQSFLADASERAAAGSQELLAEHLRLAQLSLSEIRGGFTSEELLGEIFARFCIGK